MNFSPLCPKRCQTFLDNFDSAAHFVVVKTVIIPDLNRFGEINDDDVSLMPDVDVHRFVVVGVDLKTEAALAVNRSHRLKYNLNCLGLSNKKR